MCALTFVVGPLGDQFELHLSINPRKISMPTEHRYIFLTLLTHSCSSYIVCDILVAQRVFLTMLDL